VPNGGVVKRRCAGKVSPNWGPHLDLRANFESRDLSTDNWAT
jgi:hypothetical protein